MNFRCTGACLRGYYCPSGSNSSTASPCPAGRYNPEAGQGQLSDCVICPQGSWCSRCQSRSCEDGSAGGAEQPTECPTGYTTLGGGARYLQDCVCDSESFLDIVNGTTTCLGCPRGACPLGTCLNRSGPGLVLLELPLEEGYWRVNRESRIVLPCNNDACLGGTNVTTQCSFGHKGYYCSECLDDFYSNLGSCQPCGDVSFSDTLGDSAPRFIIGISCLLIFTVWYSYCSEGVVFSCAENSGLSARVEEFGEWCLHYRWGRALRPFVVALKTAGLFAFQFIEIQAERVLNKLRIIINVSADAHVIRNAPPGGFLLF